MTLLHLLVDEGHINFFKSYIDHFGYWGVAALGMFPSLCFTVYVKWDDHRQAKAHAHHGAAPAAHGHGTPAETPAGHGH
jgi:hypothetical protein